MTVYYIFQPLAKLVLRSIVYFYSMRYNLVKKAVLLSLLLLSQNLQAQHHLFRKAVLHLPSPECYRILQDKRGIIWIATEQGLCRFDGRQTKVYTGEQGLEEKAVYALRKDDAGLIWLITKTGRILNIRRDKIVDPGFKKKFVDVRMSKFGYDLFFQKDKIYIPVGMSTAICLDRTKKTVQSVGNYSKLNYSLIEHNGDQVVPLHICLPWNKKPVKRIIRYVNRQHSTKNREITLSSETMLSPHIISCGLGQGAFFSLGSELIEIGLDGSAKIHHFPHRILSLFPDSRGGLWIGVFGHGVYHVQNGDFSNQSINSLPGLSVSNIMEDSEGHIWCTTLEKGVYICQNTQLLSFDNFPGLNRSLDVLTLDHNELLVSSKENEIIVINSFLKPERIRLIGTSGERITAITRLSGKWLIGYKERLTSGRQVKKSILLREHQEHSDLQGIKFDKFEGTLYNIGSHGVFRYEKGKMHQILGGVFKGIKDFVILNDHKFILLAQDELQTITIQNGKANRSVIAQLSVTISKLFMTKENRLFVLTKGEGLFELIGKKLVNLNRKMKIQTKVLNDGIEDNQGNLWIATNEGLLKIPRGEGDYGKPKLYGELHGLPSAVCGKVAILSNMLAVSTTEGLITIPLDGILESPVKPQLILRQSSVNGKTMNIQNSELKHNENSFLFQFSVLSYHQSKGQQIRFTLDNGSIIQRGISTASLQLQNLSPGDYHLSVFGRNVFGIESSNPIQLHFTILPPFWTTWWFIVMYITTGFILLAGVIYWIRRRIERKAEESNRIQMQLAKSQLSALQAQMNPHFIFNSISSIQNYVMSNRPEEAYDYLTAFSKLIRMTLNNSRSQFITLKRELETVEQYMQLEKRRYNDRFDFQVSLDENLDATAIQLPASLIQPLLENAVWHGIGSLEKHRHGSIVLTISGEKEGIRIVVTDNGTGIGLPVPGKESLAITILEERLAILKARSGRTFDTSVQLIRRVDLQLTEASFTVPYLNSHESTSD